MCVCFDARFARREQASGGAGHAGGCSGGIVLHRKTDQSETAGVAETRRARETGKPGPMSRHRGKAAWPHARRTAGPSSPATREAEQERPLG